MFDIDDKTAANERIHSRYMSVSNQEIDSANSRSQQILNLGQVRCQRVRRIISKKFKIPF